MAAKQDFGRLIRGCTERRVGVSTGRLYTLTSQSDIDLVADLLKRGPAMRKRRNGLYYCGEGAIDTLLLTEDLEVVGPIVVDEFCIVEEIGIEVSTAGTEGDLYTSLRRDRGDGYPGDLIHVSAAKTVTTGFKNTTGLSIPLPPGIYWAGAVCNQVTTTVATVRSLINNSPYVGHTAGASAANAAGYAQASVTGAPPTAFSDTATNAAEAPMVKLKVKSG